MKPSKALWFNKIEEVTHPHTTESKLLKSTVGSRQRETSVSTFGELQNAESPLLRPIVEQHAGLLFRTALLMTGLPDESLRCARAAFVLAARQTGHREEPNEMQLWLLRHLLDLVKHTVCGRPKPGALGKSIQSLLLTLDPVYREVIVLRHCLGLNLHAIGEILSLPERKVKSRLSIARQMLHDHSTARKDS